MAAWTQVYSDGNISSNDRVDSNLVDKIYLMKTVSFDTQVYAYDVNADTLTKISDIDSGTTGVTSGPVYFNGNLYAASPYGVYRYNGIGTSWTEVEDLPGESHQIDLARSTNHLLVILKDVSGTTPIEVRYSSDGNGWATGTTDSTPARPAGTYNNFGFNLYNATSPSQGVYLLDEDRLGVGSPFRLRLMRWNEEGTTLETEFWSTSSSANDDWIESDFIFPDILYWGVEGTDVGYDTTLDGVFITPTNGDVQPSQTVNFTTISFGYDSPGVNLLLYQMSGAGEWDAGEAVDSAANINRINHVIRMDDDSVYLVGWKSPGGTTFIYARDTTIPDGPPPGDTGKRLWVYKGNGIDWSSRGLKTA